MFSVVLCFHWASLCHRLTIYSILLQISVWVNSCIKSYSFCYCQWRLNFFILIENMILEPIFLLKSKSMLPPRTSWLISKSRNIASNLYLMSVEVMEKYDKDPKKVWKERLGLANYFYTFLRVLSVKLKNTKTAFQKCYKVNRFEKVIRVFNSASFYNHI